MKYIGFIEEHNKLPFSLKFSDYLEEETNENLNHNLFLSYLKKGLTVAAFMGYVYDFKKKDSIICHSSFYTDGRFVWPEYYIYYLSNVRNFRIDKELYCYASSLDFKFPRIPEKELLTIENAFLDKL